MSRRAPPYLESPPSVPTSPPSPTAEPAPVSAVLLEPSSTRARSFSSSAAPRWPWRASRAARLALWTANARLEEGRIIQVARVRHVRAQWHRTNGDGTYVMQTETWPRIRCTRQCLPALSCAARATGWYCGSTACSISRSSGWKDGPVTGAAAAGGGGTYSASVPPFTVASAHAMDTDIGPTGTTAADSSSASAFPEIADMIARKPGKRTVRQSQKNEMEQQAFARGTSTGRGRTPPTRR